MHGDTCLTTRGVVLRWKPLGNTPANILESRKVGSESQTGNKCVKSASRWSPFECQNHCDFRSVLLYNDAIAADYSLISESVWKSGIGCDVRVTDLTETLCLKLTINHKMSKRPKRLIMKHRSVFGEFLNKWRGGYCIDIDIVTTSIHLPVCLSLGP